MQIERITVEDLQPLEAFLASCGSSLETFRYFSSRSLSVIQNHLVTLLGFDENRIPVAYGHLDQENEVVWLGICISESNLGEGYGNLMMEALLDAARELNVESIDLTVDAENSNAIRLYEKFGFCSKEKSPKVFRYKLNLSEE